MSLLRHVLYNAIMATRTIELAQEIAKRRRKVAELFAVNPYYKAIGRQLGVSNATIKRDVKALGLLANLPDEMKGKNLVPQISPHDIPAWLLNNAIELAMRLKDEQASANDQVKVWDFMAKITGAYAPEKMLHGHANIGDAIGVVYDAADEPEILADTGGAVVEIEASHAAVDEALP